LKKAVIDDHVERLAGVPDAVLANSVVDDDRVMHGESDHCQHRRHEQRVDL